MLLHHHTYFILRFPGCLLTGPASMCACCCFLFAAIVILIRLYAFYFGSPILLHTTHSRHYGASLTYTVLWLCMWHTLAWRLRQGCFWRRSWPECFSAMASPARLPESGRVALAEFLQTLRFPGSAAFHRRVEDFRPHVAAYALLNGYTFMHICGPHFTGALLVAPAHIPGSYRSFLTLYHAIRGMCSLPVYSGRSGALSAVPPWLPHIRRSCIALGDLSTDIECMGVRRLVTVPSCGCDVTGHWGFSFPDRRLKASISISIPYCPSLSPLPLPFPRTGSCMSLLRHGVVSRPDWSFPSRCPPPPALYGSSALRLGLTQPQRLKECGSGTALLRRSNIA